MATRCAVVVTTMVTEVAYWTGKLSITDLHAAITLSWGCMIIFDTAFFPTLMDFIFFPEEMSYCSMWFLSL